MSEYITYLEKRMTETAKEEKRLIAAECKDEANLEKIKNNVYGICKTMYEVAQKQTKRKDEAANFYNRKLEHLETTWGEAYEKAKQFSDAEKVLVEEIKLAVLKEARAEFKAQA